MESTHSWRVQFHLPKKHVHNDSHDVLCMQSYIVRLSFLQKSEAQGIVFIASLVL